MCIRDSYIKIVKKLLIKQANFPDDVIFYEFSSGEKLLESMRDDYNLIFLDIQMSGIDGNETAKLLRQQNSQAILVFCTGTQQPTTESFKVHPYSCLLYTSYHLLPAYHLHNYFQSFQLLNQIYLVLDLSLIHISHNAKYFLAVCTVVRIY